MIDTPTLFILGAGASKPYGYPTGAELRADIIKNFNNNFLNIKDVRSGQAIDVSHDIREIKKFVDTFSKSSLTSIDKYLSLNPNNAHFGKMAITLSILNSEKKSCFQEEMQNPEEDWYSYLFNRMMDGFKKPDDYKNFPKNKVAFITFNYDRSLEYFLYNSFHNSFFQCRQNFQSNIKDYVPFPIIHVYGTVANFETVGWPGHNYKDDFNYYKSIENLSKGIRVIGEERTGESIKDQIKKLLPDYKRIFFLGFSYAQENLDAIDLLNNIDNTWIVYGTALGMTQKEIKDIVNIFPIKENKVINQPGDKVLMTNVCATIKYEDCHRFLREYL